MQARICVYECYLLLKGCYPCKINLRKTSAVSLLMDNEVIHVMTLTLLKFWQIANFIFSNHFISCTYTCTCINASHFKKVVTIDTHHVYLQMQQKSYLSSIHSNVLPLVADFKLIVKALDYRGFYEYDESYMVKLLTNTQ